jgi:hypothetical protein
MLQCPEPSSLCTTGLNGTIITGIFLQLLRNAFSHADNIRSEKLKECIWVPKPDDPVVEDPARSKILIESVYRWDARAIGQRPAVLVRRNQQAPQVVGISGNQLFTLGEPDPDNLPEWGREHAAPVQGGHTIFAIAKNPGTTEVLAVEVESYIRQFGPVFDREFSFLRFHLSQVGPVSQLQEADEHFAVAMTVEYAYYDTWKLIPVAPRFAGVTLKAEGD